VTFDAVGTFEIFCRINPGAMNATVVVEPGDEPPEKVRVQTFDPNFDPRAEQLRFDPPELEVRPGTEVSVANVGGASHTLTADDATFDTGEIAPGAEQGRFPGDHASFVVDEPGEYDFRCLIHPGAMQGTLVVAGEPLDAEPEEPPPQEKPDPGPEADGDVVIAMADFSFDPFEVAVAPGAQMTWSNGGSAPHTATFDEVEGQVEGLDTGTVAPGDRVTLTAPDAPGSYSYLCTIHPQMRGVVVVSAERVVRDMEPPDDGRPDDEPPDDEPVDADVADDDPGDVAAPAADEGDVSTPALVGAIALLVAGGGAIVIALRARRPSQPGGAPAE
jgi:plastocyanin